MQEAALAMIKTMLKQGRTHAFLLTGPTGAGKTDLANAVAADILGCALADLSRQPNLFRLSRPVDEKTGERKKTIPVEAVERLVSQLSLSSLGDAPKVAILEDVAALNDHGQNALLKTIEEPRGNTTLLLISETLERVLPTIRSRVLHVPVFRHPDTIVTEAGRSELDEQVRNFLAAPKWQRLLQAVALTKGEETTNDDLLGFYQRLALALHKELLEKCGTMSSEECRAKARALSLLADTPSALAGNTSQTLVLEAIVLALP